MFAGSVQVDGIFGGSDHYQNSEEVSWFDGHGSDKSAYGIDDGATTIIRHGTGTLAGDSSGTEYFFLFIEAPLYAKNMIWADDDGGVEDGDYATLSASDFDGYGKILSYSGANGSEKLQIGTPEVDSKGKVDMDVALEADLFDDDYTAQNVEDRIEDTINDGSDFGLVGYSDSAIYLLDSGLATDEFSDNKDVTMSFEFQFTVNDTNDLLLGYIRDGGLSFHLSPERTGLPMTTTPPPSSPPGSAIPSPTAMLAGGAGLLGLLARRSRRRNL